MTCPCPPAETSPILYFPAGTAARFHQVVNLVGTDPVEPANLTDASIVVILKTALTKADDAIGNVTLTVANGGIVIIDPLLGQYDLVFLPETTSTLENYTTWYVVPRITFDPEDVQIPREATLRLRLDPTPDGANFPCGDLVRGDLYTASTTPSAWDPPPAPPYASLDLFFRHESANATGDTILAIAATTRHHTEVIAFSGTTRTSKVIIPVTGRRAGDIVEVRLENPVGAAVTQEIRNATADGDVIYSAFSDDGTAVFRTQYNGTAFKRLSNQQPVL